jgi:hypothetical protein
VVKKDTPAQLIYNFNEAGFQPGKSTSRKIIRSRKGKGKASRSVPDLPETEKGENISTIKCIAADGWQIDL